ncbi:hypothetical protein Q3G72_017673 [Acer saccharum]|nr:hypothetical protein Q3G72_017673 [Acer saccharum]
MKLVGASCQLGGDIEDKSGVCLPKLSDGLDSLSWKGTFDVSPLVFVEDDMLGEGDKVVQLLIKDKMVSQVAGEMCKSEYAIGSRCSGIKAVSIDKGPSLSLAGVISNSNLLRGGNCLRKVSGGPNCSKLVDVGLEGCGFDKLEGLLRGPEVGFSDSTSENKKASDQVSHVVSKSGAEDDGLVKFGNDTPVAVQASHVVSKSGAVQASHVFQASDQVSHVVTKSGAEDDGLVKFGNGKVALSNQDNL